MLVIGLHGAAGAGKDTLAKVYRSTYENAYSVAFADPLRAMISTLGVSIESMLDPEKKNDPEYGFLGKSPRYLLQTLGTEWGRNLVDSDIWVKRAKQRIDEAEKMDFNLAFVTDCRFDNEADAIHAWGGKVIKIIRENQKYTDKVDNGGVSKHPSEAGISLDKIDFTIYNNSKIEDMVARFNEYVEFIR